MFSHMKRTTLILDDELIAELRRRAASERVTLTELVERTLRLGLASPARRARISLPSYDLGPFLQPLAGARGSARPPRDSEP